MPKQYLSEFRAHYASGAYRAVYTVSMGESIYAIHAFRKKSGAGIVTPKPEMDLIRQRLRQLRRREPSTGNVFADLSLADAGEHLKAGLVVRITGPQRLTALEARGEIVRRAIEYLENR